MGVGKRANTVYLIDFGLSKRYRDPETLVHVPWKSNKSLTGTARYASINAHRGSEQSRRDDLEAISYVLVYFLLGSLPWQGLQASKKRTKFERIAEKKMSLTAKQITRDQPAEFRIFIEYCRNLPFDHRPDYFYLRQMFRHLLFKLAEEFDFDFDWIVQHREKQDSTNVSRR